MNSALSILFAGDFAPCREYESLVLERGADVFGDLKELVSSVDVAFLNLESPLCTSGEPIAKTGPNFRAHPDCIHAVSSAGFNVVGLANNHILDFGEIGLQETIEACTKANLTISGGGEDLESAQQVPIIKRHGLKIAVIAVAEHEFSIASESTAGAAPLDVIDNTFQIESVREEADLVIVTVHGGNEYFPLPRPGLRKLCRFYIKRGADAVICHHPHVPGAYELFDGKPIIYSLGNLIFDHPNPPENWEKGYAVKLTYDLDGLDLKSMDLVPYTQSVAQGGISRMSHDEEAAFMEGLKDVNGILQDEDEYRDAWRRFCSVQKNALLMKQYLPVHFRGMRKFGKLINPELLTVPTKTGKMVKLNLIRCESHLEVLQSILSDDTSGAL